MSDQHNANCIGAYGNRVVRTPAMDRIAANGVRFDRAYANNPICAPSRLCLHSGQYVHTHGHFGNDLFHYPEGNPNTLGAQLRRHGYQTAVVGKSHMIRAWDEDAFEHRRYCDLTDADRRDPTTNHYFQ
jgi:arylsulfatase A-like enzyme